MKIIRLQNQKLNVLLLILLFSALGVFSFVLLIHYTELAARAPDTITTFGAVSSMICIFNILGFSLLKINDWLARNSPLYYLRRSRLVWHYLIMSVLFLSLNYALFVSIKWIGGASTPFVIGRVGLRLIFAVWFVDIIIVSLLLVNHSARHTLKLYMEKQQLQEATTRAQYMALQSQLNPHFLFNSLNTLIAEIEYDPANAVRFTQNLSDVYRYILQQQDQLLVSLSEELQFLDYYIFLHQVRLGECLRVENDLPEEVLRSKVPPLTLQLLAENVIKHNYMNEKTPVTIRLSATGDGRKLIFSNNRSPKKVALQSGKGLKNLAERYRLLSGETIKVNNQDNLFVVEIPLMYE